MSVAHVAPERNFRGPGCTEKCVIVRVIIPGQFGRSELLVCDRDVHEAYGRAGSERISIVRTGPLGVDRWAKTATLGEREIDLTAREWQVVDYLAARIGRLCSTAELATAIGQDVKGGEHNVRMVVDRVRCKFGASAALIENRFGRGYRLIKDAGVRSYPVT